MVVIPRHWVADIVVVVLVVRRLPLTWKIDEHVTTTFTYLVRTKSVSCTLGKLMDVVVVMVGG